MSIVDWDEHEKRVVASFNACEHLPISALEAGIVKEAVEALRRTTVALRSSASPIERQSAANRARAILSQLPENEDG